MEELYLKAMAYLGSSRMLFRGFCIEKINGTVVVTDIRTPYYKPVSKSDLKTLLEKGFVVGTTFLLMESDKRKISRYKMLSKKEARLSDDVINPRKKMEHTNTIDRFDKEINYYSLQVRRWQEFLKHKEYVC